MATTEVADHLLTVDFVEEANVYGVKVPGNRTCKTYIHTNLISGETVTRSVLK